MKIGQICHSDDIENVSMRVVARRPYWCYPVAIAAYNAFPHSRSQRLGIHDAQAPTGLQHTTIVRDNTRIVVVRLVEWLAASIDNVNQSGIVRIVE